MVESYLESLNHLQMVFQQRTQKIIRKTTIADNRIIIIKINIMRSKNIIILTTKRMTPLHLIIIHVYINSSNKSLIIIILTTHLFIIIIIVFH